MRIQENKTQWESKDMPINFTRWIEHFHNKKANEIWDHFIEIVQKGIEAEKKEKRLEEEKKRLAEEEEKKRLAEIQHKFAIDVCERYIEYLKRNNNSETIEIFKLQCELLDITP